MTRITKSRFEDLIDKKASNRVHELISKIIRSFPHEINGNGAPSIEFNEKCGELSGKSLFGEYFNDDDALLTDRGNEDMLNKYTNWPEIKKQLMKQFEEDETDKVLKNLSGISDFLDREE